MKKLFLCSTLLALSLVGCKSDDSVVDPVTPESEKTLLVGKWNMIKGEIFINGELTEAQDLKDGDCNYNYFDFKNDGTKNEVYHNADDNCAPESFSGTWTYKAEGKLITLEDDEDGYVTKFNVVAVNSTDLKIKVVSDGGEAPPEGAELYIYLKK